MTVEDAVAAKMLERARVGLQKYGVSVGERTDLTPVQWLEHAQEEAMDEAVYLEKLKRDMPQWRDKPDSPGWWVVASGYGAALWAVSRAGDYTASPGRRWFGPIPEYHEDKEQDQG